MAQDIFHYLEGPRVYNLFPKLAGPIENWLPHIERASAMGFNWVYLNPFHPTGKSGSLYAIKDHFGYNPLFFTQDNGKDPQKQLTSLLKEADRLGISVSADLVINHTSTQSPLIQGHPDWYKRDDYGQLIHPGAMDKGKMVYWKDLAEIDNYHSTDRESLWSYWFSVAQHYLDLGFRGFRCDAAYQVPSGLWHYLIQKVKEFDHEVLFFAETLGCSVEQTLEVAYAGFDYIYNSFKWWDMEAPWFIEQHRQTQPVIPSISFPESHDTKRLAAELRDNIPAMQQRYILSALFTRGVMTVLGFEFGFHKRLNVKTTTPEDWEEKHCDLSGFIKKVNHLKSSYRIFNLETPLTPIHSENQYIKLFLKGVNDDACLLIVNKDRLHKQSITLELTEVFNLHQGETIRDISLDGLSEDMPLLITTVLSPSQVKILYKSSQN